MTVQMREEHEQRPETEAQVSHRKQPRFCLTETGHRKVMERGEWQHRLGEEVTDAGGKQLSSPHCCVGQPCMLWVPL